VQYSAQLGFQQLFIPDTNIKFVSSSIPANSNLFLFTTSANGAYLSLADKLVTTDVIIVPASTPIYLYLESGSGDIISAFSYTNALGDTFQVTLSGLNDFTSVPIITPPLYCAIPNACQANQTCTLVTGGFTCGCPVGYTQDNGCVDVNECLNATPPCAYIQNSVCQNTVGSFQCVCELGQDPVNLVCGGNNTNSNNGLANLALGKSARNDMIDSQFPASLAVDGSLTTFTELSSGRTWTVDLGESTLITYLDVFWAVALNTGDGFQILLDDLPFDFLTHVFDANSPDLVVTIGTQAQRVSLVGVTTGFVKFTEIEVWGPAPSTSSCVLSPNLCSLIVGSVCTDSTNGPSCQCTAGFTSDPLLTCVDVNECTDPDICAAQPFYVCTNLVGSYLCGCQEGFSLVNGICTAVDPCASNPCIEVTNSVCTNLNGNFSCVCNSGLYLVNRVCSPYCQASPSQMSSLAFPGTVVTNLSVPQVWSPAPCETAFLFITSDSAGVFSSFAGNQTFTTDVQVNPLDSIKVTLSMQLFGGATINAQFGPIGSLQSLTTFNGSSFQSFSTNYVVPERVSSVRFSFNLSSANLAYAILSADIESTSCLPSMFLFMMQMFAYSHLTFVLQQATKCAHHRGSHTCVHVHLDLWKPHIPVNILIGQIGERAILLAVLEFKTELENAPLKHQ